MTHRRQFLKSVTATAALSTPLTAADATPSPTRILIVVGPTDHPPGTHEVAAGGRLMKHGLENSGLPNLTAEVVHAWPKDQAIRDAADSVVFIGDSFPLVMLPDSDTTLQQLGAMMDRSCGIVCVHYATGLRARDVQEDGDHPLLHWLGGYFANKCPHHQSIARVFPTATISPADPTHPVWNGCGEFTLHDEPYINNYFGPADQQAASQFTPLAVSMLPPNDPKRETVAWGVERQDSGRGFGIVMPHFYRNWKDENLRRFLLNGIIWSARHEVPERGIQSRLPDLTAFDPASVEPRPRRNKPKPKDY